MKLARCLFALLFAVVMTTQIPAQECGGPGTPFDTGSGFYSGDAWDSTLSGAIRKAHKNAVTDVGEGEGLQCDECPGSGPCEARVSAEYIIDWAYDEETGEYWAIVIIQGTGTFSCDACP